MGIFDSIKHAIFGDHGPLGQFGHAAAPAGQPAAAAPAGGAPYKFTF